MIDKICLNCEYGHQSLDHPFIWCLNGDSPDRGDGSLLPDHTCKAWIKRDEVLE